MGIGMAGRTLPEMVLSLGNNVYNGKYIRPRLRSSLIMNGTKVTRITYINILRMNSYVIITIPLRITGATPMVRILRVNHGISAQTWKTLLKSTRALLVLIRTSLMTKRMIALYVLLFGTPYIPQNMGT